MAEAVAKIGLDTSALQAGATKAVGIMRGMASKMSIAGNNSSLLGEGLGLLLGGAALNKLVGFAQGTVNAAESMASLNTQLAAAMGSASAAALEMEKLQKTALMPGLSLEAAVVGSSRLQTLGLSASQARKLIEELGNASVLSGGGAEDVRQFIDAIVSMGSAGEVSDAKIDRLTERSATLSKILKDTFGDSTAVGLRALGVTATDIVTKLGEGLSTLERATESDYAKGMREFNAAVNDISVSIGNSLIPMLGEMAKELVPFIEGVKTLGSEFTDFLAKWVTWASTGMSIAEIEAMQESMNRGAQIVEQNARLRATQEAKITEEKVNQVQQEKAIEESAKQHAIASDKAAKSMVDAAKQAEAVLKTLQTQQFDESNYRYEIEILNARLAGNNELADKMDLQMRIQQEQKSLQESLNLGSEEALQLATDRLTKEQQLKNLQNQPTQEEKRGKIKGVRFADRGYTVGDYRGEYSNLKSKESDYEKLQREGASWRGPAFKSLSNPQLNKPMNGKAQANAEEIDLSGNSVEQNTLSSAESLKVIERAVTA